MHTKQPAPQDRRKLTLDVETVKHLSNEVLDQVVGGRKVDTTVDELTVREASWCVCAE